VQRRRTARPQCANSGHSLSVQRASPNRPVCRHCPLVQRFMQRTTGRPESAEGGRRYGVASRLRGAGVHYGQCSACRPARPQAAPSCPWPAVTSRCAVQSPGRSTGTVGNPLRMPRMVAATSALARKRGWVLTLSTVPARCTSGLGAGRRFHPISRRYSASGVP
jgi:hypothetical protein